MSGTWWAVPGTLSLILAWTSAVVVLRVAPRRSLNRRLALVLFLEGSFFLSSGVLFLVSDARVAFTLGWVAITALAMLPFQYLSFLSVSLDTALVAPFRSRTAFRSLWLASLSTAGLVLAFPHAFVGEPYRPGWAPWNVRAGPWGEYLSVVHGLVMLFGLAAALLAYRRTGPGTAARTRAQWFAIAFGVRDVSVGVLFLLYPLARSVPHWGDLVYNPGSALIYLVYIGLLAYGVLRTHLFDIDLKLKLALERSSVGAMIGATFFVASEGLEGFVPVEGPLLGVLAAALIVTLLHPVQHLAERFADRVMRTVQDTPGYRDSRKLEVYRAALEGAVQDGVITEGEREILARLQRQLGLSPVEAERAEREVVSRPQLAL